MEDDEMNDEIAAAMGFSSFGGSKKRKFDHTNSPKTKPDASGANSTKLGVRPKTSKSDATGASEIADNSGITSKETRKQKQPAPSGLAAFLNRGQNLPDKPPTTEGVLNPPPADHSHENASATVSFGGPPISRAELNALRHGVKTANGDTAYFLPSFVEDPWPNSRKA
ncbi:hypothetical protein DM02DRAFT_644334 [Periconia macrospinosa]|uniref:Uncharacterized protein n=1 Tax=Periconia macrospinosa TaxID=97972 RepID=A0A2V1DGC1_9PLEO|nr:hypothetical protein DM02DRAFT_644334 [Periconia macrospinosa]